ncbi:MAG: hypothetical protein GZ088_14165, partial [Acidipila sp.]|nr:hypothetical protein [Acidipila sp.]
MLERLQKIIARAGLASRRHAEELILAGTVSVNGKVVTELGTKADAARDHIRVGSKLLQPDAHEAKRYFMLHKPPQVVATMNDPERRPSLRAYVQHIPGRMFPIGRLEFSGSGLLILTSDGDLASRLLRVARRLSQTYWVKLNGRLSPEGQRRVEEFAQAQLRIVRNAPNPWYEARFTGASRDRLRRALSEEKLLVEKFLRTGFAGLELGDLPAGGSRPLAPEEISRLERATTTPVPVPAPVRHTVPLIPAAKHVPLVERSSAAAAERPVARQDSRPAAWQSSGAKDFRRPSSPPGKFTPSRATSAGARGAGPAPGNRAHGRRDEGVSDRASDYRDNRGQGRPDSRRPDNRPAGQRSHGRPENRPSDRPSDSRDNRGQERPDSRRPDNRPAGQRTHGRPDNRPTGRPSDHRDSRLDNRPSGRPSDRAAGRPSDRNENRGHGRPESRRPDDRPAGQRFRKTWPREGRPTS